jgi:hypothetical protein
VLALGQVEIPRAQGVLDRQGQASLPRIAVELACRSAECPAPLLGHKGARGIVRDLFEGASIQLSDHGNSVEQTVIALRGGKGAVKQPGKVCAETGITGPEEIPITAFCEPLKRAEVCQRTPALMCVKLLPPGLLREGWLVRPVQEQVGGLKHHIHGAFLALA